MSTRSLVSIVARLATGAAFVMSTAGCGSEMLRTGRSPVYLTVETIEVTNGATEDSGSNLLSDVLTLVKRTVNGQEVRVPTIFNDTAIASIRVTAKNETVPTTALNSVTLNRYRINFRRSDGRNTPGVDVPYGFEGGLSATIAAGSVGEVGFEMVRHSSKSEPPLRNLISNGGQMFIYTIAEVTFFGYDQNGNEVSVTTNVDVAFSDFGDPD
jgi:hypothetical protein